MGIFLFRFFFPKLESSFLNEEAIKLLLIVYSLFYIKKMLKKFNFFAFILTAVIEFYFSKYLIKNYFNNRYNFTNDYYLLAIFICSLSIMVLVTKNMMKEIQNNHFISYIISRLENYLYIYHFFYFFNNFLVESVMDVAEFSTVEWNKSFFYFFASLLYLFFTPFICNFAKYIKSFINKDYYMRIIIRKYILVVFISFTFIVNYNKYLGSIIYDNLFTYVGQPYNSLIYNAIPFDKDFRFKIILLILFENLN